MATPSMARSETLPRRHQKENNMTYLKIKRSDTGEWHFLFNIIEAIYIGSTDRDRFDEYGARVVEYLNDGDGDPYVIILTTMGDDVRAYAFWATEAYLCDQKSGMTVEYLFNLRK